MVKYLKAFVIANLFLIQSVYTQQENFANNTERPNVIVVMTDDQGYGELSCHGNPVLKTPNLDKLYNQSVRLTDYHATPMCTPTRGEFLTGIDAAANGAVNVSSGRTLLYPGLTTLADLFTKNDYSTAIFGKWHLGDNYPYIPELRGFQETLWFPSSHISSVPDYWGNDYFDDTYIHNGSREKFTGYCTDVFFNQARQWMNVKAKKKEPFFVFLPLNAPHYPWIAPEVNIKEMQDAFAKSSFSNMEPGLKSRIIRYLAMIRNVDMNMGRLMNFLDDKGLSDNTILIFTTDNGSTFGPEYYNAGMRGKKTELWEGGHRVPFFIRWPNGGLGSARDISGLTQVKDILPTLVDFCKLITPDPSEFTGINLADVLHNESAIPPDRMMVINYSRMPVNFDFPSPSNPSIMKREGAVVLWKSWRLVEDDKLYDLVKDPLQENNIIHKHPDIVTKMRAHLDNWWAGVSERVNEPQSLIIGNDAANPMLLTSCEWMDVLLDQQIQVRSGMRKNSYWNIMVEKDGEYELELRRWPRESNLSLMMADSNSVALPVNSARIYINDQMHRVKVEKGDKAARFVVKLKAGKTTLHTWFNDHNNQPLCGAYYVYVNRK